MVFFSGEVAAAGDEGQLVCDAGAAGVVSGANRFLLPLLQRAVVYVCLVTGCFGICGCPGACMIVVMFCCHVRIYMRVCHVMLQNAL